jgi:fibronectin-binding autotransporter adhesin
MKRTVAFWQHAFLWGFFALVSIPVYGTAPTLFTWDGGATTTNWGDANNWNPDAAPVSSANNIIIMSGTAQVTNTVNGNQTIHSLVFSNTAGAFVIGGGTLTIDNVAGILQNSPNEQRLTNAVATVNDQTWAVNSNSLILSGPINLGNDTITINGNANTIFLGEITGAANAGDTFVKNGAGYLILAASNSFAGNVTVNAGTVVVSANRALGADSTTISSGATLAFSNSVNYVATAPTTISGTGTNNMGAINNLSGNNTFAGALTLGANSRAVASTGNITLTGGIDLSSFFLSVSNASTAGTFLPSVVSGTGGLLLHTGTLTLSASNTFTGALTNLNGLLIVTTNHALGTVAGGTVISSGSTLGFSNSVNYAAAEAITVSGTGLDDTGAIKNLIGTNRFAGPVTLAAASTFRADADQLTFTGAITNGGFALSVSNAVNSTIMFSNRVSGTGGLIVQGGGTVKLMATNSFTGTILVTNSTLELQSHAAVSTNSLTLASSTLTVKDGSTNIFGALTFATNSTISLNTGAARSSLTFTNLTALGGTLVIDGWTGTGFNAGTDDRIFFTTDPGQYVTNILFSGGFGVGAFWISGTGELVPAPEPGSILNGAAIALLIGLEAVRRRRRVALKT